MIRSAAVKRSRAVGLWGMNWKNRRGRKALRTSRQLQHHQQRDRQRSDDLSSGWFLQESAPVDIDVRLASLMIPTICLFVGLRELSRLKSLLPHLDVAAACHTDATDDLLPQNEPSTPVCSRLLNERGFLTGLAEPSR